MKIYLLICSFLALTLPSFAQDHLTLSGQVTTETGEPLPYAHVIIEGTNNGTLANTNGYFALPITQKNCGGKISVSYIGYHTSSVPVACSRSEDITIKLKENISTLRAVEVKALSAEAIVKKVIQNLEKNYSAAAEYTLFTRELEQTIGSTPEPVQLLEAVYKMQWSPQEKTRFNIIKIRAKAFNSRGKQRLNDARLITLHKSESLNMLRFGTNFLKERKTRRYNYKLAGYTHYNNKEYYVIQIESKKDNYLKGGEIWVDPKSYGVAYLKEIWTDDKWNSGAVRSKTKSTDEIYYQYDGDKWYLSHGKQARQFSFAQGEPLQIVNYTVATSRNPNITFTKQDDMGLMAQKIKEFTGEFNDAFWQDYTYIPLDSIYRHEPVID